jgi:MoaA/NifB/PqqE/SkfB family radical SAM enzyme
VNENSSWLVDYIDQGKEGKLTGPAFASWIVTRACNLKCYYCFANARKRDPDELSTGQAKQVLDDLADNGLFFMTFMGGEPLMRKDIFELIDYSTDLGMYAAILTNGMLVRKDTVPRLADAGCQMLGVSIDSHDPLIHDAVRGVKGSLVGAKRAVAEAVRHDMRCSVRIVVTQDSLPALPGLFRWAREEGVEELILIPIFMVGRAAGTPDDRRADIVGKENFFKGIAVLRELGAPLGISVPEDTVACCTGIELNAPDAEHYHLGHAVGFERSVGCRVGRFIVNIQPNGEVFSCPFVHYPIGDLRTQSIADIWHHPLLEAARGSEMGCHARSIIHTGTPMVPDPTYLRPGAELLAELGTEAGPAKPRTFLSLEQITTPR